MPFRWLFRRTLKSAVQARASEAIQHAAQSALAADPASGSPDQSNDDAPCRAAILFESPIQLEAFRGRLRGVVTNRAARLDFLVGGYNGYRVVAVACGKGNGSPRQIVDMLLAGHQPKVIIVAGKGLGLTDRIQVGDIVVANEIVSCSGRQLTIDFQANPRNRIHMGRVVTIDTWLDRPAARHDLARKTHAIAADLVSFPFAEVCLQNHVPFMSVRVITESVDEMRPRDILHVGKQKSLVGKTGAFTGAFWRRPGSLKDLWKWKERDYETSDRLAAFLGSVLN